MNDSELATEIKHGRALLTSSGWTHTRSPGELADPSGKVFVRTSYTRGAYRLTLFGRERGTHVAKIFQDLTTELQPRDVEKVFAQVVRCGDAEKRPNQWPLRGFRPSTTNFKEGAKPWT